MFNVGYIIPNPYTELRSPRPMVFLDELAANATAHNVSIIVYSGNSDFLISHRGSEGVLVSHNR